MKQRGIDYTEDTNTRMTTGLFSSRTEEWETPQYVFDQLNAEFNFTLDVCATEWNKKCERYFDKVTNGLKQRWSPHRCFMNPPYGKNIYRWMAKAYSESKQGALVVCLIHARTDTKWWHTYAMQANEIRFIMGRMKFGDGRQSAPFPSCIVIFRPECRKLDHPIVTTVRYTPINSKQTSLFRPTVTKQAEDI